MLPHVLGMGAAMAFGVTYYLLAAAHIDPLSLAGVWIVSGVLGSLFVSAGYLCPCRHAH